MDTAERLDATFGLLSDRDRRRLLYYLREHGSATRTELTDVLAGWEATDRPDGVVRASRHHRLHSSLYHRHLPALREAGLVSVDDDTVTTTDWPAWVDRCLDIAFEVETTVEERRARPDQGSGEHDRSRD
jgi:DNA-binding transcriptional ArsR family regulator